MCDDVVVFKVRIIGTASDGRLDCSIITSSLERVEALRKFARKNKYQFSVEMIDND